MRRSPLRRKTRLRSRPKAEVSPAEERAREAFGRVPATATCAVCGRTKRDAFFRGAKLDAHHVIAKQKLKRVCSERRLPVWPIIWDQRNRLYVCTRPCHADHTSAKRRIPLRAIPPAAVMFAEELGLTYLLLREYAA